MGYSPLSCKESDMTEVTEHAAHVYKLFFFNICMYFWLCLGLHCCAGFSPVAFLGLLVAVAPLVVEHMASRVHGLQWLWLLGSRTQAQLS